MNLYGFAGGDPVNFTDPFGLTADCLLLPCPVVMGAGSILGGLSAGTAATIGAAIAIPIGLGIWASEDVNPHADGGPPGALVGSDATRVKPTVGEIADAVGESGATVTPHPTKHGEGTLIKWLDGSITDIRVETHPIPGSKGQPVKHGNVDTKDPSGQITKKHIPDTGGPP